MDFLDVSILWYSVKIMKSEFLLLFCSLIIFSACREMNSAEEEQDVRSEPKAVQLQLKGCRGCHAKVRHDEHHAFKCIECHGGNADSTVKEQAHAQLIAQPAHPDYMTQTCGKCHPKILSSIQNSTHFTLRNKINLIRNHFGSADQLNNLTEIPVSYVEPTTVSELADDMLRRRCLRCHVYSTGDDYPYTQRAAGCGACHMAVVDDQLISHEIFRVPSDLQCMSCHYGNYVGADYYGRFQNDFNIEYRTPYTTSEDYFRPYGVEYHDLAPDIHQQRGMTCVDCHSVHHENPAETPNKITCKTCHEWNTENESMLPQNLTIKNGHLILISKSTGKEHIIPQASHPAHELYGNKIDCQVCHAQWTFNDFTTHLLRSDTDDLDPWRRLTVQSSSEIETLLEHNLFSDEDELDITMHDTITGRTMKGIWLKGYTKRRWEDIIVKRDRDGIIKTFRPILDLRLSYINEDEETIFDNATGTGPSMLPYTPHTTGPAGLFYLNRFQNLLNDK